jgi:hypothetical protein
VMDQKFCPKIGKYCIREKCGLFNSVALQCGVWSKMMPLLCAEKLTQIVELLFQVLGNSEEVLEG